MQTLYDVVRATGAKNVVAVSGLDWGFDLSGVMKGYALEGRNIIYETHPYEFKHDWDKAFVPLTDTYVVYLGEWGGGAQQLDYGRRVMDYVRRYNLHWTAWDFHPQAGPTLIRNWSFEPTVFGQFVKDLLADAATEREQKETN
jgi:hypothetical protein